MVFARQIRHILLATLVALALVGASAAYWAIAGRESLLLREDNPRRVEALARIQRGSIADRNGRVLAQTVATDSGLQRRYLESSTFSLTGYYSLRYGVGGAEAAYDEQLAGARELTSFADYFNRQILRLPQVGADIMLTIDTTIHDVLASAMIETDGAAIVADAQSGELLALVSLPSFDPNQLDETWSELIAADGNPFFNRALQGNYQLGGNIYTLWLAQAIGTGFELSLRFTAAADPLTLDDGTEIRCLTEPPAADLTLIEALTHSCPAPFNSYLQTQSASAYDDLITKYRITEPAVLPGFPQPAQLPPVAADAELEAEALALRNILGQGAQTTAPLRLVSIISAIANDGIAKSPWIHAATRQPNADQWLTQSRGSDSMRMLDAATAQELRSILRETWHNLSGRPPDPVIEVGAYPAMSRAGDETQLWLNGYVAAADNNVTAFVILLEDTADFTRLLSIGHRLIDALSPST